MNSKIRDSFVLYSKGMAMGAADIVPGVSGGTVALITGIYDQLLKSIRSINTQQLQKLVRLQFRDIWIHCNGTFLITLAAGIATSIIGLSGPILYALQHHPEMLRGLFFGLILASAKLIAGQLGPWHQFPKITGIIGILFAITVNQIPAAQADSSMIYMGICGAIAICAMILPGISGSFILLLLGNYDNVLNAIRHFEIKTLSVFAAGCITGLLSFSHALGYALQHHRNQTMALLTGFMLGSLQKIWPWRMTTHWRINSHGEQVPWIDHAIFPTKSSLTDIILVVICAVIGFFLVQILEKHGKEKHEITARI
ncbi:MAG: DUF368 domain-containing protein [Oligoflexales bacterium]